MSRVPGDDYSAGFGDDNYDTDYGWDGSSGYAGLDMTGREREDKYYNEPVDYFGGTRNDAGGGSGTDFSSPGEIGESLPGDGNGGDGGNSGPYSDGGTWADVDATDKDNEIADYLWDQSGPFTQGIFDGSYQEGLPSYANYMQNTGMGSLQNYMGQNVNPLTSYFTDFMENNPAWEQNAKYGEDMLLERMGQYGGSASGGFSGQQQAGLGRYWSDQTADRWSQAAPAAMSQWGQDYSAGLSDYSNMYGQHTMDFGNQLSAYNRPYDYSQNLWGNSQQGGYPPGSGMNNQGGGDSNFWGGVGSVAGMGIGAWATGGSPWGAALGGGAGEVIGSWFD